MQKGSHNRGFSFIEVLIVLGLVAMVGSFALFVSMETFRGQSFRSDRDLLIAALQRARSQSMSNICVGSACSNNGAAHGVHIATDSYTIFQGQSYAVNDQYNQVFDANPTITRAGSLTDIVFTQLSGTTTAGTITLAGNGQNSTITISAEGQVTWTN